MVYAITQSEWSRKAAHELDDLIERWRLRKEVETVRVVQPDFFDELDLRYNRTIEMIKQASDLGRADAARRAARQHTKVAHADLKELKKRLKFVNTKKEKKFFEDHLRAKKEEIIYCQLLTEHIAKIIRHFEEEELGEDTYQKIELSKLICGSYEKIKLLPVETLHQAIELLQLSDLIKDE